MNKKVFSFVIISLLIFSCNAPKTSVTNPSGIPSDLQEQINKTSDSNQVTAQNALLQAKLLYGQLSGRWNSVSPIDIEAYTETREKFISSMFIVSNALSSNAVKSDEKTSIQNDFKQLYYDSLTNMLRGINNNLSIYQSYIENSLSVSISPGDFPFTNDGITTLANIFYATETVELLVTQSGQFENISPADETQKLLNAVKNQQTTIINGIINFSKSGKITLEQTKTSYQIIVKGLTSPGLLTIVNDLAISVFGKENVAFKKDEVTSVQNNPNLVVMVIKESKNTYRSISIENGKIVNRLSNDDRGLSAADILNQSNVNVIKVQK